MNNDFGAVLDLLKNDGVIGFLSPRLGKMQSRRLIGARLQDTLYEPLDPLVLERIPPSCRGRWAVTGHDPDRGEERTHFLEFMERIELINQDSAEFEIMLFEQESTPEVVAKVPSFHAAVIWLREWIKDPLGLIVGLRKAG